MTATYWLTVTHQGLGLREIATIRRTLMGLAGHGFIADLESYSDDGTTCWSWHQGSESGTEMLVEAERLVGQLGLDTWSTRVGIELHPPDRRLSRPPRGAL